MGIWTMKHIVPLYDIIYLDDYSFEKKTVWKITLAYTRETTKVQPFLEPNFSNKFWKIIKIKSKKNISIPKNFKWKRSQNFIRYIVE